MKSKKHFPWRMLLGMMLLLAVGLSACTGKTGPSLPEATTENQVDSSASKEEEIKEPTPVPQQTETATTAVEETEAVSEEAPTPSQTELSETEVEEKPVPTVRPELMATDPETVNLASGDIQLVEFFAFW
ncbi:MAG: hypothetical protein MAG431_02374 [Chloroflexi bacterium]|nr:hypothetical protein [Chloroflexota bacterium]